LKFLARRIFQLVLIIGSWGDSGIITSGLEQLYKWAGYHTYEWQVSPNPWGPSEPEHESTGENPSWLGSTSGDTWYHMCKFECEFEITRTRTRNHTQLDVKLPNYPYIYICKTMLPNYVTFCILSKLNVDEHQAWILIFKVDELNYSRCCMWFYL
jgi:hypothetical protein